MNQDNENILSGFLLSLNNVGFTDSFLTNGAYVRKLSLISCAFSPHRCTSSSSLKELGIIQTSRMLSLTVRLLLRKKVES